MVGDSATSEEQLRSGVHDLVLLCVKSVQYIFQLLYCLWF